MSLGMEIQVLHLFSVEKKEVRSTHALHAISSNAFPKLKLIVSTIRLTSRPKSSFGIIIPNTIRKAKVIRTDTETIIDILMDLTTQNNMTGRSN